MDLLGSMVAISLAIFSCPFCFVFIMGWAKKKVTDFTQGLILAQFSGIIPYNA